MNSHRSSWCGGGWAIEENLDEAQDHPIHEPILSALDFQQDRSCGAIRPPGYGLPGRHGGCLIRRISYIVGNVCRLRLWGPHPAGADVLQEHDPPRIPWRVFLCARGAMVVCVCKERVGPGGAHEDRDRDWGVVREAGSP